MEKNTRMKKMKENGRKNEERRRRWDQKNEKQERKTGKNDDEGLDVEKRSRE